MTLDADVMFGEREPEKPDDASERRKSKAFFICLLSHFFFFIVYRFLCQESP